jgi:hypothetical protein
MAETAGPHFALLELPLEIAAPLDQFRVGLKGHSLEVPVLAQLGPGLTEFPVEAANLPFKGHFDSHLLLEMLNPAGQLPLTLKNAVPLTLRLLQLPNKPHLLDTQTGKSPLQLLIIMAPNKLLQLGQSGFGLPGLPLLGLELLFVGLD